MNADFPPLLTTKEVADLLRIEPETVLDRMRRGEIPGAIRPGRHFLFRRDQLLEWIRESSVPSPSEIQ